MYNNNDNGQNSVATSASIKNKITSGFNFYYPAGGGDLNSIEEIFDYWKRTNFHYAISCREFPTFRASLVKEEDGEYVLNMFDNEDDSKVFPPAWRCGKRLTDYTKNYIIETIVRYMKEEYILSNQFRVIYKTPEERGEIYFSKRENADAFIAAIKDEGLNNPGYAIIGEFGSYIG